MRWFRMHANAVANPKLKLIAFEDRWHFVAVCCLKCEGLLDDDRDGALRERLIAAQLGLTVREADEVRRRLAEVDLIREDWQPKGWDKYQYASDNSTDRVRKFRSHNQQDSDTKRPCNVSVTPPDTDTDSYTETKKKNMGGKPPASEPDEFIQLRAIYPKRSGDQRWKKALDHCRARLREGHTWDEILDGARRYAAWCKATDKIGTETVKQAATFVGTEKGFAEPWTLPKRQLSAIERVLNPEKDDERLVN